MVVAIILALGLALAVTCGVALHLMQSSLFGIFYRFGALAGAAIGIFAVFSGLFGEAQELWGFGSLIGLVVAFIAGYALLGFLLNFARKAILRPKEKKIKNKTVKNISSGAYFTSNLIDAFISLYSGTAVGIAFISGMGPAITLAVSLALFAITYRAYRIEKYEQLVVPQKQVYINLAVSVIFLAIGVILGWFMQENIHTRGLFYLFPISFPLYLILWNVAQIAINHKK